MKYCPKCNLEYHDEVRYCENDGGLLREALTSETLPTEDDLNPRRRVVQKGPLPIHYLAAGAVGLFFGFVIAVVILLIFYVPIKSSEHSDLSEQQRSPSFNNATVHEPAVGKHAAAPPAPTGPLSTTSVPSPSPTELPTQEAHSTSVMKSTDEILKRPENLLISTGGNKESKKIQSQTLIRLQDGRAIQADEVWEDNQGVWYRQGGFVALVERARVAAISKSVSPTESAPSTTSTP